MGWEWRSGGYRIRGVNIAGSEGGVSRSVQLQGGGANTDGEAKGGPNQEGFH